MYIKCIYYVFKNRKRTIYYYFFNLNILLSFLKENYHSKIIFK